MENLKRVLLLNAITSAFTGLILVMFSGSISELFQLDASSVFTSVGIFLIVYGGYVVYTALKASAQTQIVIVLDILWVAGSAIVLLAFGSQISMVGNILTVAVALWVGLMAYLQRKFSRGVITNE